MLGSFGEWVGGLFGTKKATENLLDKDNGLLVKAGSWFGNLHYSDQEQANDDKEIRDWGIRQLEALAPFKVMQRIMVTIIMVQWALLFNLILLCIMLEMPSQLTNLVDFAQSKYAWMPISAAVTLYLLGGVWPRKSSS